MVEKVFGKAQLHVGNGYGEQKEVHRAPPQHRIPTELVNPSSAQGREQHPAQAAEGFQPEVGRPVQLPGGEHIEHVEFDEKLQNNIPVNQEEPAHFHCPPTEPAYQLDSSARKAARLGRLIWSSESPTCTVHPLTRTTNVGLTR